MENLVSTVLSGLGVPLSLPKRITFEYTQGQTLVLQGASMLTFWNQFIEQHVLWTRLMQGPAPVPSEQVQNEFAKQREQAKKPTEE